MQSAELAAQAVKDMAEARVRRDDAIRAAREGGLSIYRISQVIGMTDAAVAYILKRPKQTGGKP